jgi:hypothetical protein
MHLFGKGKLKERWTEECETVAAVVRCLLNRDDVMTNAETWTLTKGKITKIQDANMIFWKHLI